jgi:hypothetical protein
LPDRGDQAAFEAFQRYRHSHPSAATPQLLDALRYVIMDPRIGSVFGFEVSVHNADGEFRYRDYAITLTEQQFFLAFPTVFLRENRDAAVPTLIYIDRARPRAAGWSRSGWR